MSPQPDRPHPLIEPRLVAAVGLIALGSGLGISLMLAKTLGLAGLAISLVSSMGAIWIYARHFRDAYTALRSGIPNTQELLLVFVILALIIPLSIMVYIKTSAPETGDTGKPEVSLKLLYPDLPQLHLVNISDKVAFQIKWIVILFNTSKSDRKDPLPVPVSTFDFLRPRQHTGNLGIFVGNVLPLVSNGDILFGSASTVCPDCQRGHTFWVYIEYGKGGWYSEVPEARDGEIMVPKSLLHASPADFMNEVLPTISQEKRIPIQEPSG